MSCFPMKLHTSPRRDTTSNLLEALSPPVFYVTTQIPSFSVRDSLSYISQRTGARIMSKYQYLACLKLN
ncbi:hypothetical protein K435DRAFT_57389 [Dendrothele bispora CBS 962.96]|uniref:Uncharacterized protein n=1 Tax=Dendrothele bispora (strain CBS 962.96) TaxID=1314807 RepID=A0A4S8KRP1_DENBC|nr:hypothetical protein K435DRAFT_57389 [Dendrothele bispora CBS 962.96]